MDRFSVVVGGNAIAVQPQRQNEPKRTQKRRTTKLSFSQQHRSPAWLASQAFDSEASVPTVGPTWGSDLLRQREGVLCAEETNKSVAHHGNANHLKPRGQDESRSSLWDVDESREDGKRSPVCVFHCQTRPLRG
ncbi:hypothetical protein MRB53_004856 [Persea americana]|uniref:Uncharacterized protein n=1 Tax=Persea americana TaxID=3435 RepID=A0ACC2MCG6_PERAE|nr:hypothetical protein MRB53_004856 [Persea americana]